MRRVPETGGFRGIAAEPDSVMVTYLRLHVGRIRRPAVARLPCHDPSFGRRAGQDVMLGRLG